MKKHSRSTTPLLPLLLAFVVLAPPLLGGCVMLAGTAAIGGTAGTTMDRRTTGTLIDDQSIEWRTRVAFDEKGLIRDDVHVSITSYNRVVLLSGEVPDEQVKQQLEQIAREVREVRGVHNELVVAEPTSLQTRSRDTLITTRAKLALAGGMKAPIVANVKVVTENGVVFLMGIMSRAEGDEVTRLVQTVPGVQQIVRLFEYTQGS